MPLLVQFRGLMPRRQETLPTFSFPTPIRVTGPEMRLGPKSGEGIRWALGLAALITDGARNGPGPASSSGVFPLDPAGGRGPLGSQRPSLSLLTLAGVWVGT